MQIFLDSSMYSVRKMNLNYIMEEEQKLTKQSTLCVKHVTTRWIVTIKRTSSLRTNSTNLKLLFYDVGSKFVEGRLAQCVQVIKLDDVFTIN